MTCCVPLRTEGWHSDGSEAGFFPPHPLDGEGDRPEDGGVVECRSLVTI